MTDARSQAYKALSIAAERIGMNNYSAGLYKATYRNGHLVSGYRITAEHAELIEAMPKVLSGEISVDDAMALLHQHDTMKQRIGATES